MRQANISIVIPAYNEATRIGHAISTIREYMDEAFDSHEIIIVDDGSTDSTVKISKSRNKGDINLIQSNNNMGKGHAIKTGVLASRGDLVLLCDADLSTPIDQVESLLLAIDEGFDIAIGSRGMKTSTILIRQPWYRELMGKGFNLLIRLLLMSNFRDTQCGFKLFSGESARKVFEKVSINGFSFDVEALFVANKLGYRIKEVPVSWLNHPPSKVRLAKDSSQMFLDLLAIRARWKNGLYG